jgi:hypothetical protein
MASLQVYHVMMAMMMVMVSVRNHVMRMMMVLANAMT